jgi:hypothetical protein
MKRNFILISISIFILNIFLLTHVSAQPWTFIKEVDGIKIYTQNELNTSLKSYKGETDINASMEKVCALLGSAKNFDWWGEDFSKIKILDHTDHKFIQYYFIYDMPWPVADRDLVVESIIKMDTINGKYTVSSKPLLKKVPVNPDFVRINKYRQKWTVQPISKGKVHIVLEGFIDPGGNVPSWLLKMLVSEMPLKTIRLLRNRAISSKPANK